MATAKLVMTVELVESLLFGWTAHRVSILDIKYDAARSEVELVIAGQDVPHVKMVVPEISARENRAGERFRQMRFIASDRRRSPTSAESGDSR